MSQNSDCGLSTRHVFALPLFVHYLRSAYAIIVAVSSEKRCPFPIRLNQNVIKTHKQLKWSGRIRNTQDVLSLILRHSVFRFKSFNKTAMKV